VIDGILVQLKGSQVKIVLVNELDRDDVQSVQYKYKDHNLHFVRGNFVKQDALARANVFRARSAIVLADKQAETIKPGCYSADHRFVHSTELMISSDFPNWPIIELSGFAPRGKNIVFRKSPFNFSKLHKFPSVYYL
jgi:hypothetical protein